MKNYLTLSIIMLFLGLGFPQVNAQDAKVKSAKDLVEDAEYLINRRQFSAAKEKLTAAIKQKPKFVVAYRLLGVVNKYLYDFEGSVAAYEKLFELHPGLSRAAYYEAGEAFMKNYQYKKALGYFMLYKNSDARDYKTDEQTIQRGYDEMVDRQIKSCEYARGINFDEIVDEPENLGSSINSVGLEYLPTLTADGRWLIFTSEQASEDILVSRRKKDDTWTKAESIGNAINTPMNEGMAKFTVCGRTVYFSACAWENVKGGCDIYQAGFDTQNDFGVVDNVEPVKGVNSDRWDSQPAISCDGTTMYFTSSRDGGQGGTDIWISTLGADGIWNVPVNAGPTINSKGDEEAPYIAPDGVTLYFSSDGHPGLGEADIFRTVKEEAGWTTPMNLGQSINTPFREAGISISPEGDVAYYASARPGGIGGLDIYRVGLYREISPKIENVMLDGYIYDAQTKEPVAGVKVKVGKSGQKKITLTTDQDGRFFICLGNRASYSYITDKKGYQTFIGAEYFKRTKNEPTKRVEVFLTPTLGSVTEEPPVASTTPKTRIRKNLSVYFGSGKYELSEVQKEQIRKLITQFDEPEKIKIKITGFADDVGNKEFNLSLSEKRASIVAQFVEVLEVPRAQITYDGKGIVESNIPQHQKRRVEIIIVD
ncbi:MAG: OmpA family protein [Aureispira sp.]|nr:OmpA family protein [Aureispira sp.]